jgi:hypothetical protein
MHNYVEISSTVRIPFLPFTWQKALFSVYQKSIAFQIQINDIYN